jgi:hypothetical protein
LRTRRAFPGTSSSGFGVGTTERERLQRREDADIDADRHSKREKTASANVGVRRSARAACRTSVGQSQFIRNQTTASNRQLLLKTLDAYGLRNVYRCLARFGLKRTGNLGGQLMCVRPLQPAD